MHHNRLAQLAYQKPFFCLQIFWGLSQREHQFLILENADLSLLKLLGHRLPLRALRRSRRIWLALLSPARLLPLLRVRLLLRVLLFALFWGDGSVLLAVCLLLIALLAQGHLLGGGFVFERSHFTALLLQFALVDLELPLVEIQIVIQVFQVFGENRQIRGCLRDAARNLEQVGDLLLHCSQQVLLQQLQNSLEQGLLDHVQLRDAFAEVDLQDLADLLKPAVPAECGYPGFHQIHPIKFLQKINPLKL